MSKQSIHVHTLDNGRDVAVEFARPEYLSDLKFSTAERAQDFATDFATVHSMPVSVKQSVSGNGAGLWYVTASSRQTAAWRREPAEMVRSLLPAFTASGIARKPSKGLTLGRLLVAGRNVKQWVTREYLASAIDVPVKSLGAYMGDDLNTRLGYGYVGMILDSGTIGYTAVLPGDVPDDGASACGAVLEIAVRDFDQSSTFGDETATDSDE